MKTQAFPITEIAPYTYEIGEFECASIFLLAGDESAMLNDSRFGIGDLKGFIDHLTEKPLMVCYNHKSLFLGMASSRDNLYIFL